MRSFLLCLSRSRWPHLLLLGLGLNAAVYAQTVQKTRVDFSAMQIRGQTKQADRVTFFDRGQDKRPSTLKPRVDYRKEILSRRFK